MWLIIETFITCLIGWAFITQILIPSSMGRPLFPFFRWRNVQKELAQIKEEQELAEWKAKIEELLNKHNVEGEKNGSEQKNDNGQ